MDADENMKTRDPESEDEQLLDDAAMEMNNKGTLDIGGEVTNNNNDYNNAAVEMEIETDIDTNNNNHTNNNKMEEDEVRSEATFRFVVEDVSKMKEQVLSAPCYVRNLPWKIMAMPRNSGPPNPVRSLGFYLQCNGESENTAWSCRAAATLRLLNHKPGGEPVERQISHLFFNKENDWGFSTFLQMNEVLDQERGFIKNDSITLEVHVMAEAPHGVFWDSKKHTGYVGLKNQGATCYMNSLLQTLYFTNYLRKAVYKMPTEADDSSKSVALALQRVFNDLQFCDKPVGTKKLTKSFGWETLDSFMQHDVQEFLRVLLDKLESKMKGTCIEGTIPRLFEGKMSSYINCKNVEYTSSRTETFYDIQLNIKGKKDIFESFEDYVAPETLDGDNKYDAGEHGLQDAEKGVIFVRFPPVLHLHLMRFQYDPVTDNSVKFNDRFEFYSHINLDKFLQRSNANKFGASGEGLATAGTDPNSCMDKGNADYTLHAVLVHSGDNHGGHYVVYINPLGDGKWCKFDDDVVSRCDQKEAIEQNYGGGGGGIMPGLAVNKHCSNAYMLVYIRDSCLPEILQRIDETDIPSELVDRLQEEKRMEHIRRRERTESSTYMTVNVVLEEYFEFHQTVDLFDLDKIPCRVFKVKRTQTLADFLETIKETFKLAKMDSFRLWKLVQRKFSGQFSIGGGQMGANFHAGGNNALANSNNNNNCVSDPIVNNISRPVYLDVQSEMNKQLFMLSDNQHQWYIFLETTSPALGSDATLPPYDKDSDTLLFFKCYDPRQKRLNYVGLDYFNVQLRVQNMVPVLNRKMGWPEGTELTLYQEQGTEELKMDDTIEQAIKPERVNGEIVIFERRGQEMATAMMELELPTVQDYFKDLMYRIEVTFCDKTSPNDAGFTLELSQRMTYKQWASAVGQRLNVDPYEIQFFRCFNYKDVPGQPLSSSCEEQLKDVLLYCNPKKHRKIFYQVLNMNINELESKKRFPCCWVPISLKEEKEIILYPNKLGTVSTLLEEARKQVELCPELGSGLLRLTEVNAHKLSMGPSEDTPLQKLQPPNEGSISNTKIYRIEEIPKDEINLRADELLVPVSHFHKEAYNAFGIPFFLKIRHEETFASIRERIKVKLGVPDKEWEKYKLAIINGSRVDHITDDDYAVNIENFRSPPNQNGIAGSYFGLEHVNKFQKRSRFTYMEKAIKIYN